jgi:hypothetical protein
MARALECPACGTKHRVERLPDTPTFRCTSCGQTLRIPPEARPGATDAAPGGTVAPPPRRRADGTAIPGPVAAPATITATVSARGEPADANGARNGAKTDASPSAASKPATRRPRVPWWWRLLAWVVAVPLGLVITAISAYDLGWLKKDDLLDVFIGSGTDRYTHLAVATLVWALVTALLVQLFVEGGRWLADRRRARRSMPPVPGEPDGDTAVPPPRRAASPVDVSR